MSTEPASTSQKKILVIDDNEIILKTTSMKLQSAGYQVFTALDGSEGVAAVRREKPDLVAAGHHVSAGRERHVVGRFPHHGLAAPGG